MEKLEFYVNFDCKKLQKQQIEELTRFFESIMIVLELTHQNWFNFFKC